MEMQRTPGQRVRIRISSRRRASELGFDNTVQVFDAPLGVERVDAWHFRIGDRVLHWQDTDVVELVGGDGRTQVS